MSRLNYGIVITLFQHEDIVQPVLDSIEAISERSLATLSSLMSGDDSESYYKTMEVIIVQSIIKSVLDSIEAI